MATREQEQIAAQSPVSIVFGLTSEDVRKEMESPNSVVKTALHSAIVTQIAREQIRALMQTAQTLLQKIEAEIEALDSTDPAARESITDFEEEKFKVQETADQLKPLLAELEKIGLRIQANDQIFIAAITYVHEDIKTLCEEHGIEYQPEANNERMLAALRPVNDTYELRLRRDAGETLEEEEENTVQRADQTSLQELFGDYLTQINALDRMQTIAERLGQSYVAFRSAQDPLLARQAAILEELARLTTSLTSGASAAENREPPHP